MSSMALQKTWMKELPQEDIEFAKTKAASAIKRLHGDKKAKLDAFRDVAAVHDRLSKRRSGSFGEWVVEELKASETSGSHWAKIGDRYDDICNILQILADDWGAWYLLAKLPDARFKKVRQQLKPGMGQRQIRKLLKQFQKKKLLTPEQREAEEKEAAAAEARARALEAAEAVFDEVVDQVQKTGAIKVSVLAEKLEKAVKRALKAKPAAPTDTPSGLVKELLERGKYLTAQIHEWADDVTKAEQAFSAEAKAFVLHNYRDPMVSDLQEVFHG